MSTRLISNIVIALAGAVVVVVTGQALSPGATGWLAFGAGVGVLGLTGVAQLERVVAVRTAPTAGIGLGRSRPDRRSS